MAEMPEQKSQKLNKPNLRVSPPKYRSILIMGLIITAACIPIIIKPYFDSSTYQKIQNEMRPKFGKTREELQPGGLRPWSDPFKEKMD